MLQYWGLIGCESVQKLFVNNKDNLLKIAKILDQFNSGRDTDGADSPGFREAVLPTFVKQLNGL